MQIHIRILRGQLLTDLWIDYVHSIFVFYFAMLLIFSQVFFFRSQGWLKNFGKGVCCMNTTEKTNLEEQLHTKFYELLKEREEALNVMALCTAQSPNGDLHVLCERPIDDTLIVWTAYKTEQLSTSFSAFYNGYYDLTMYEAVNELERRSGKSAAYFNCINKE